MQTIEISMTYIPKWLATDYSSKNL